MSKPAVAKGSGAARVGHDQVSPVARQASHVPHESHRRRAFVEGVVSNPARGP
jgi:hypothetical protein